MATAANAGRIWIKKDPMVINYAQWLNFAKRSFEQAIWKLIKEPKIWDDYITKNNNSELERILKSIDDSLSAEEYDF